MKLWTTQQIFSGICVCGHSQYEHHGNLIMNAQTAFAMNASVYLGECEHYGCNEHYQPCKKCPGIFIDKDDPFKNQKVKELAKNVI